MSKKNTTRTKTKKASQNQARTHAKTQTEANNQKFFAWLGDVLSTGMTQEDFNKARALFEQGISADVMKANLSKPYKRPK